MDINILLLDAILSKNNDEKEEIYTNTLDKSSELLCLLANNNKALLHDISNINNVRYTFLNTLIKNINIDTKMISSYIEFIKCMSNNNSLSGISWIPTDKELEIISKNDDLYKNLLEKGIININSIKNFNLLMKKYILEPIFKNRYFENKNNKYIDFLNYVKTPICHEITDFNSFSSFVLHKLVCCIFAESNNNDYSLLLLHKLFKCKYISYDSVIMCIDNFNNNILIDYINIIFESPEEISYLNKNVIKGLCTIFDKFNCKSILYFSCNESLLNKLYITLIQKNSECISNTINIFVEYLQYEIINDNELENNINLEFTSIYEFIIPHMTKKYLDLLSPKLIILLSLWNVPGNILAKHVNYGHIKINEVTNLDALKNILKCNNNILKIELAINVLTRIIYLADLIGIDKLITNNDIKNFFAEKYNMLVIVNTIDRLLLKQDITSGEKLFLTGIIESSSIIVQKLLSNYINDKYNLLEKNGYSIVLLEHFNKKNINNSIELLNIIKEIKQDILNEKEYDKFICKICYSNNITNCFNSCGHVICSKCLDKYISYKCPFCKTITGNNKLFFM